MRKCIKPLVIISSACMATLTAPAFAQNIPAKASGNWEDASIWVGGGVPNSSNNVYIGATDPAGAVLTSTVTLTANESISNVFLGYGTLAVGTLNLNGHALAISGALTVNDFTGTGHINEGGGSFTAGTLAMYDGNSSLTLGTGDAVTNIDIENGATLTTSTTGNITAGGSLAGAALNLGADMSLSNGINVEGTGAALNLAGHNFSAGTLWLGYFLSSPVTLQRGSGTLGTLAVTNLDLGHSQNLALIAGDTVTNIDVETGATLTSGPTGNITTGGSVANGGTLDLGANLSLGGGLNVESTGSGLNLAGHNLSVAGTLWLGYFQTSSVNFNRGSGTPGTLTATNLDLGNGQNLALIAGDTITSIDVENNATLTTATTGNISGGGNIVNGSDLVLGADMNLTSGFNVEGTGATLNIGSHNLKADSLALGYFSTSSVNFNRTTGTLNLNSLSLGNGQNLTLIAGDTITGGGVMGVGGTGAINLYTGSTLSTVGPLNVTCTVNVVDATLNLGTDMHIGNQVINTENGGTVNLAGHNLAASLLLLGYDGTSTVTLNRGSGTPGTLTLGNLFLGNGQNLTLIAGDTINAGDDGVDVAAGATLTTVATSNITNNVVNVETGGALKLGANLSTTGNLNVQDTGSTFDAQGQAVTAAKLLFGSNGTASVSVSNLGTVMATELHEGNSTSVTLHGGDVISSLIDLENSSVLTVQQSIDGTGLTLNGTSLSDLTIDPSSMDLVFTSTTPGSWDFRWEDPNGTTNWISTLTAMVNDQQIHLTLPPGQTYQIVDSNGYTYVSVPEPSSLMLMGLGLIGLGTARTRSRRMS